MAFDLTLLGVQRNIPKVDFREYAGLIQGIHKVGKSRLVSLLPNTILAAFEQGYDASVVDYIDCTGARGWDAFIEFVDRLEEHREAIGTQIRLVAIDTVEEAYVAAETHMLLRESRKDGTIYKTLSEIPYGAGYAKRDEYFRAQIRRIYAMGLRPVYVSHTRIKTIRPKDKNKEPYEVAISTMPERLASLIYPEVSYILHVDRALIDGSLKRVLRTKPDDAHEAGSRVYLGADIPFDTEEEAIEKFAVAWKAAIEQEMRARGVTDDVEKVAQQQEKAKAAEIAQTAKRVRADAEALAKAIKDVKREMKALLSAGKITNAQVMQALTRHDLTAPDAIADIETANAILAELSNFGA